MPGWVVTLTKKPRVDDFRDDYFPRKFYYKKDAERLVLEVEEKGGKAAVSKELRRNLAVSRPQLGAL